MSDEQDSIADPRDAIIRQQAETIQRQADLLVELQDKVEHLQALLEGIETLASETTVEGTQVSDALLAALERVERFVKDSVEAEQTVVPTGRDARTPPQYRTLVEAYYRRLSEVGERPDTER